VPWNPERVLPALAILSVLATPPLLAADKTAVEIAPGPRVMSAEEKALQPDPAHGSEHGLVLTEETSRDESAGTDTLLSFHLRAKIFTAEARSLADVELPYGSERSGLKKWWGVTIQPDGTVQDLPASGLHEEEVARAGGERLTVLKSNLAGAVPGSVLDVGFVIWIRGIFRTERIPLQGNWPVRDFRYRWLPGEFLPAAYHVARVTGLNAEVVKGTKSILIQGHDLPAAVEEAWMPPVENSVAAVTFYYLRPMESGGGFWDLTAKRVARRLDDACRDAGVREAVATAGIAPSADLPTRLRRLYDWMAQNVRSRADMTVEEEEKRDLNDETPVHGGWAHVALTDHVAADADLERLYACMARAVGAEAEIVLATDRRRHLFDASLLSADQFDTMIVVVRAPGDPDERAIFVDNGMGLGFGDVAWWLTGAAGFLTDPKKARSIRIPPSPAATNVSEASVSIRLSGDETGSPFRWSRVRRGQYGLEDRRLLRHEAPEDRRKRLEEVCGASDRLEVTRAEAPHLESVGADTRVDCEGRLVDAHVTPEYGSYTMYAMGPWTESLPALPAGKRVHPVVLEFPHTDVATIEIESPPGFAPNEEDLLVPVKSSFGDYRLSIQATAKGYHVERRVTLNAVGVPADHYEDLRAFLTEVARADRTGIEFHRKADGS
jgi:hypothetical protein